MVASSASPAAGAASHRRGRRAAAPAALMASGGIASWAKCVYSNGVRLAPAKLAGSQSASRRPDIELANRRLATASAPRRASRTSTGVRASPLAHTR